MSIKRLSTSGSRINAGVQYPSMLAGYGDFGAMQRIGYFTAPGNNEGMAFTSIPQTFQDLMFVANVYVPTGTNSFNIRMNNVITGYSMTQLIGNGSSATSQRATQNGFRPQSTAGITNSSTISYTIVAHILNYRASTFKTVLFRCANDRNGAGETVLDVGLLQLTDAINIVQVSTDVGGSFLGAGSTFALYGVKASAA